jgi:hypothetical protein
VKEPAESRRNALGCYGLMIVSILTLAILAVFGIAAPEKGNQDIEISAVP